MYGKFRKCDYCGHRKRVSEQHDFMLGMDTTRMVCSESDEYELLVNELIYINKSMFDTMENKFEFKDCKGCKLKNRSLNSKKYFDSMLEVIDDQKMDLYDKLSEVYLIETQYFNEFGSF